MQWYDDQYCPAFALNETLNNTHADQVQDDTNTSAPLQPQTQETNTSTARKQHNCVNVEVVIEL